MSYYPRNMRPLPLTSHTILPPPLLDERGFIATGNTATMASVTIPIFAAAEPQPAQTVLVYSNADNPPQLFHPENSLPFEDTTIHSLPANRHVLLISNVSEKNWCPRCYCRTKKSFQNHST